MNRVQKAAEQIERALELLNRAKENLRYARNDQHIPVAVQIAALEEIYDILNDPTCTPEFWEEDEYV